ncbi:DUF3768 domain-containing protein [Novosphingobium sp. 32-60-15]|uniref:DUF3768 domain-containing protein n=1 Tax=Novosphingobium sp. 32-60-15 TaxID=1970410 RepID=UPI0025E7150B|nr:DUF3768 domain-containing protein [Novosphingobium sp. 32-60-15]
MTIPVTEQIARLNDRCRQGFDPAARLIVTRTCLSRLAGEGDAVREIVAQAELLAAVRRYDFAPDDGPERDFGAFDLRGERILFKIDLYDAYSVKVYSTTIRIHILGPSNGGCGPNYYWAFLRRHQSSRSRIQPIREA